jgi:hypothetical protein
VEATVWGVHAVWCLRDPRVVFGFLSRVAATETLTGRLPGTFLFRLSNSSPGQLALAYVDNNEVDPVRHDLVGNLNSLAQFSSFLLSKPFLQWGLPGEGGAALTTRHFLSKIDGRYISEMNKQYSEFISNHDIGPSHVGTRIGTLTPL